MNWLLRFFSPRAWQRYQFQQIEYQLSQLSVQIQNLQFEIANLLQTYGEETDGRLDHLQSSIDQLNQKIHERV